MIATTTMLSVLILCFVTIKIVHKLWNHDSNEENIVQVVWYRSIWIVVFAFRFKRASVYFDVCTVLKLFCCCTETNTSKWNTIKTSSSQHKCMTVRLKNLVYQTGSHWTFSCVYMLILKHVFFFHVISKQHNNTTTLCHAHTHQHKLDIIMRTKFIYV